MSLRTVADRFAHLRGIGIEPVAAVAAAVAAVPEVPATPAPAVAAAAAADEEDDARGARRSRKSRRAKKRDDDDDDDDEDDEDESGDDEEDDDDDDDMKKAATAGHGVALDAAFRLGARAQRRRMTKILSAPAAAKNIAMAVQLACDTALTARQATALLDKNAAPQGNRLADRGSRAVSPGGAPAPQGAVAVAASWDAAMKDYAPR